MYDLPVFLPSKPVLPVYYGQHFKLIKKKIPQYLIDVSPEQRARLKSLSRPVPGWYTAATEAQKNTLNDLIEARVKTQNRLGKTLGHIQPLNDFAKPLLEEALASVGCAALSVTEVYLRVYVPQADAFGVTTGGYRVKTLSLLQAALHNFELPETKEGYFAPGSAFITRPDELGRFRVVNTALKINDFATLCRTLDLGQQYQQHVQTYLNPSELLSQGILEYRYITHQKAMLKVDAQIALFKGDIDSDDHAVLMRVIAGERQIKTGNQQVWYRYLSVMELTVKGCVVFDLCVKGAWSTAFLVWIPGDPEHPLKKYTSFFALRDELVRKLTVLPSPVRQTAFTPYQQLLSQFIAHKDRPYYYQRLTELVKDAPEQPWGVEWLRSEKTRFWINALTPKVSLALTIKPNPHTHQSRVLALHPSINVSIRVMGGENMWEDIDFWNQQFKDMRGKVLGDARTLALSTADTNANNRAARLSHYLNMGLFAVNLLSMAVPAMGEVMMVVMAGQLLSETIEGLEEWEQGDTQAVWRHISDVLENLATMAAGAVAFHVAIAPGIEKLKAVTLPSGKQRLWSGELRGYEQSIEVAPDSQPDTTGLRRINGQNVLLHEGSTYVLVKDPASGHHRVVHPTRPQAYQPVFRHNGQGVWIHEGESPITWDRNRLKRRLGQSVPGLTDNEIENLLVLSEVKTSELRRMLAESEPMPMLLMDNMRQYTAYAKTLRAIHEVRTGRTSSELCSYSAIFSVDLPGWPQNKALELFDSAKPLSPVSRYGNHQATGADVIHISRNDLMEGQLSARIVDGLNQEELQGLLGAPLASQRNRLIELFNVQLVKHMELNTQRLFTALYEDPLRPEEPEHASIELLKRLFPRLPTALARRLVIEAPPNERQFFRRNKIPARLMHTAGVLQRKARLASAYLGLYFQGIVTTDTEVLVLNTLENIPGWQGGLRLEVRGYSREGQLRSSVGAEDAPLRKVLVRVSEGQYLAADAEGNALYGIENFYSSLLHALPEAHRKALRLTTTRQGDQLKVAVQKHVLSRSRLSVLLKMKPERRTYFQPPQRLADGRTGYLLSGWGAFEAGHDQAQVALKNRFSQLYPSDTAVELQAFFDLHGSQASERLSALEKELSELERRLQIWEDANVDEHRPDETLSDALQRRAISRQMLHDRLIQAWRRTGPRHLDETGQVLGQSLSILIEDTGPLLESLPALGADFGHVSQLSLWGVNTSSSIDAFLAHFPHLRELSINQGSLTALPTAIARMLHLQVLDLLGHNIVLTPESVELLSTLTQMRRLVLNDSPLGTPPDISRMPYLRRLSLSNCALDRWPSGLFAHPRTQGFKLEMEHNPLRQIPEVEPGSERAQVIARTLISRDAVSETVRQQYDSYRQSVGITPVTDGIAATLTPIQPWLGDIAADELMAKKALWDRIEHTVGAEPFFQLFSVQVMAFEYRPQGFREDMTNKLWRMLEAMDESSELRDKLFEMASAPLTCVDSGTQIFNAMGVEVLLHEAYQGSSSLNVGLDILDLARGKARLDELGRIARARVRELEESGRKHPEFDPSGARVLHYDAQGLRMRDIDEVEIYLSYTTALADRLGLPWQSPSQMYPEVDVTESMIDNAYLRVRALERGEGLRNQLLEQPAWLNYIQSAFAPELDAINQKITALTDLHTAQTEWLHQAAMTTQQRNELRTTLASAASVLGKSGREFEPGQVMSNETYDAQLRELDAKRLELLKTITDQELEPIQTSLVPLFSESNSTDSASGRQKRK